VERQLEEERQDFKGFFHCWDPRSTKWLTATIIKPSLISAADHFLWQFDASHHN